MPETSCETEMRQEMLDWERQNTTDDDDDAAAGEELM